MDQDLEELVRAFSGYGVEPWMTTAYRSMAQKVQDAREKLRQRQVEASLCPFCKKESK